MAKEVVRRLTGHFLVQGMRHIVMKTGGRHVIAGLRLGELIDCQGA